MKAFRYLWILLLPLPSAAQQQETPYDPAGNHQTWSIKGKTLPWTLGDDAGISSLAGVEYGFLKNQSIGVDGYVYYQEASHDQVYDTANVEHAEGNDWHSIERALFLNYRYYFNFPTLRQQGLTLYLLAFGHDAWINRRHDPLYPDNPYVTQNEHDKSLGFMIGGTLWANRLGLDVNVGVFEKEKDISTMDSVQDIGHPTLQKSTGPGFRLSVNFTYAFYH